MAISVERATMRDELVAEYRTRTPRSAAASERACRVMPGGDTRAIAFHAPYPLAIERASGPTLVDVDGNAYLDFVNNYTSLLHGHAHPTIEHAVREQLPKGTNYATAITCQAELAELLVERVPSVDLVRFTNSGTEATLFAVRAARAFTGRELIVKIEGGYHGAYDDFEISVHPDLAVAGPDGEPVATLDTRGVPRNRLETVAVVPFNDVAALERLFTARGGEIAGLIMEPCLGSAGVVATDQAFVEAARRLTRTHGALLILDEVMTFRLGPGGFQGELGVDGDLTTFAKIIGGGFPVGAFGGREDVMAIFDPRRPDAVWHSGTFAGNAVTMVAGRVALELFDRTAVDRLNVLGDRLRNGLAEVCARVGVTAQTTGFGSFVGLHFTDQPVAGYREPARSDLELKHLFHMALLAEGVFVAPRMLMCMSTPMDEHLVDDVLVRAERALRRVV